MAEAQPGTPDLDPVPAPGRSDATRWILLVEDDPALRGTLAGDLGKAGFNTVLVPDGTSALERHRIRPLDLILLDLDVRAQDALLVLRTLKPRDLVPVFALAANPGEARRTECFNLGADDFLEKPFSSEELVARIRAILKRTSRNKPFGRLRSGPFLLDRQARTLARDGVPVRLTPIEFRILEAIFANCGQYLSQAEVLLLAWPPDSRPASPRTVGVHMVSLRRKLTREGDQAWIVYSGTHGYGWSEKIQEDRGEKDIPNFLGQCRIRH